MRVEAAPAALAELMRLAKAGCRALDQQDGGLRNSAGASTATAPSTVVRPRPQIPREHDNRHNGWHLAPEADTSRAA
jgi:hypothetical protein